PLYVGNREHPQEAVDRYYRYVDHGVLEDLKIDWDGLEVDSIYPGRLPDLYASHAVVILGRYREPQGRSVAPTISGRNVGKKTRETLAVQVLRSGEDDRVLETLWARSKITDTDARYWDGEIDRPSHERIVTNIGLEHHLVTAFTSFVAVDRSRVVGDGNPDFVRQAVDGPEDVDPEKAGAQVVPGRSFQSIVEIAPTASRDASGISLAGSTGAESKYQVEASVVYEATVQRSVMVVEADNSVVSYANAAPITRLDGPTSWPENASMRIRNLEGGEGTDAKRLRKAIRSRAGMFEACYVQHRVVGKRRLAIRLRFDAAGALADIELVSGSLGDPGDGCIRAVLKGVPWSGQGKQGSTVELMLVLDGY
ncbi:MAG: hypothetical protein KC431_17080, partial [Myxococcales bacterium]|nr:hypothetical protein [Myxococcales bacterium]